MEGQIILVVGGRGRGKTTMVKNFTSKSHPDALFLHDVGGNHKDYYKKPFLKFDDFIKICTRLEECLIVFEEATIFIGHAPIQDIKEFCVTSRYRGNTILFVFHSLRSIPRYIFDLANKIILFKTNDNFGIVDDRFQRPEFTQFFQRVNASPDEHACALYTIEQ